MLVLWSRRNAKYFQGISCVPREEDSTASAVKAERSSGFVDQDLPGTFSNQITCILCPRATTSSNPGSENSI